MTRIDRRALVARHGIRLTEARPDHVLSAGNGDFAVTVDASGMQSFGAFHDQGAAIARAASSAAAAGHPMAAMVLSDSTIDTGTLSTWGWHEMPNPDGFVLDDAMTEYETARGPVRYPDRYDIIASVSGQPMDEAERAGEWLHENPQRLDLGRIGLELREEPGGDAAQSPHELRELDQHQDLWNGLITTRYSFAGERVEVRAVVDPEDGVVAYRIASALLADGRARVVVRFPYASTAFAGAADWNAPDRHVTLVESDDPAAATVRRTLDDTRYVVRLSAPGWKVREGEAPHTLVIEGGGSSLELVARFAPGETAGAPPAFDDVLARADAAGDAFWNAGAALDLSGVPDERAAELERRVVLSQHLTRVHGSGRTPPQETGLATNSWQGKFHLEMHFWHAAHFPAWGRPELLTRSLDWYLTILDAARETARRQGYPGARWPKQTGPDGRESPTPIGALLAWQQPHPLYLLELVWNAVDGAERARLLDRFGDLVDQTATFMAAFPVERDGVFHLGPPIMPAQESYDARMTADPTFELAYWWWGLEIAQRWRERAGLEREAGWDRVMANLASPHRVDGRYLAVATGDELQREDHPSLLAAFGFVPPTPVIDPETMEATLLDVLGDWNWGSAWGWDFPVMAMTATRLGHRNFAVDALLRPENRNRITPVGHNPQLGAMLPLYLPGNGALLAAVAVMVQPGADGRPAGFPETWDVRAEGFVDWPTT